LAILTELSVADPQNEDFRQAAAMVQAFACEMMIKTGSADEAIKLLSEAHETLSKSFAASPTDQIVHFRMANVEAALGQGYLTLASDERAPEQRRLTQWREARSWLQKSQDIYKTFLDAGELTGDDATRLDVVTEDLAKCDAAIARLTRAGR
jgi:hypothetical protein